VDCLKANFDSISFLADKVDFVARILNGRSKIPVLETFESVDRSGNWDRMRMKFINKFPLQQAFPKALGPLILMRTDITELNLVLDKDKLEDISSSRVVKGKIDASDMNLENVLGLMEMSTLYLSPVRTQNMRTTKACLAHIPYETHTFAWCNPVPLNKKAKINLDFNDPNAMFFIFGGFVYFDVNFNVTGVNAVAGHQKMSNKNQLMLLFEESQVLTVSTALALEQEKRWGNVTLPLLVEKGAKHLAWIVPGEKLGGVRFPRFGGFAFLFQPLESLLKVPAPTLSKKAGCGMFYPMLG